MNLEWHDLVDEKPRIVSGDRAQAGTGRVDILTLAGDLKALRDRLGGIDEA